MSMFVLQWFYLTSKHIVALNNEKDDLYCENLDHEKNVVAYWLKDLEPSVILAKNHELKQSHV